jgi:hypothetical protein
MRIRYRDDGGPGTFYDVGYYYTYQLVHGSSTYSWSFRGASVEAPGAAFRRRSEMYDHGVSRGTRHVFNDCTHLSLEGSYQYVGLDGGSFTEDTSPLMVNSNPATGDWGIRVPLRAIVDAAKAVQLHAPPEIPTESFAIRFFMDARIPKTFDIRADPFEDDFSIYYVLVDLWDLKKGFSSLLSNQAKLRKFRNSLDRHDVARKVASTHLGIKFGIIPTIADMQALIKTIKSWSDKYKAGALSEKRYKTHSSVEKLEDTISEIRNYHWNETVATQISYGGHTVPFEVDIESRPTARWHGQAIYGFSCPEFSGWISRLAQICDSFGVLDPAAIWDVVPFSFVLDWFFGISQWLHANRPRLFPATAIIHDYLESVKVDVTVTYRLRCLAAQTSNPGFTSIASTLYPFDTVIAREVYTTYLRRRMRPDESYVKLLPGTRRNASFVTILNRVAISSSLIAQRVPR